MACGIYPGRSASSNEKTNHLLGLAVAALFAVTTGKKSLSLATKQGMFGYTANNNVRAKSNAFEFGRNKLGIDADIACS